VVIWAGSDQQREQITQAALELMPGDLLAAATATSAEPEDITAVLLLTGEDDFNALAAAIFTGSAQATIYRLAPSQPGHGVVAPFTSGQAIFAPGLTRDAIALRHDSGARITAQPADGPIPAGTDLLFLISPDGTLTPATPSHTPDPESGGMLILLSPAPALG
jgi:hypothetical protein